MKYLLTATATLWLVAGFAATAQTPPPKPGPAMQAKPGSMMMMMKGPAMSAHADWHKGGHIAMDDWKRGEKIDYRPLHLDRPKRGYEWRRVDNNYVLAAVTTGLIASVIVAGH